MDGQLAQQKSDVRTELDLAIASPGDCSLMTQDLESEGLLGLEANTNMGSTGDASAAAADQDNNGGETLSQPRTAARRSSNRRNREETIQLEAAFRENPHPDEEQRTDLGKRLGITGQQVKFWFQNRRSSQKTQDQRRENRELQGVTEALQVERRALRSATWNNTCLTCGGPTVRVDDTQQHLLSENARLKEELQRAKAFMETLAPNHGLPPPSHHAHVGPTMPVNQGLARSQSDTNTLLIDLAALALNEFCKLVSAGSPMWLPTPDGEVEVLNLQHYVDAIIPSTFGPYRMGFGVDGTRKTGDVMCTARNLVGILMDAAHWSGMFPGIVPSATASNIVTPSASSQHGRVLLMDAELRVLSPRVPIRKIKFVRQCQEVQPGKWAVVDVSIDGIIGVPPTYTASRLRPSGCLIEDSNNGCCKVTWIVNMEYDETNVLPLYRLLLRSGQALGACRWLGSLQRQCECLAILHTYTVPALGATDYVTAIVRKNLFEVAHQMTRSFYVAMCGPWRQPWRSVDAWRGDCGIGVDSFELVVRIVTSSACSGALREQDDAVVLSATAPVWLPGIPAQLVFDYLCDGNRRGEWDSLANGAPLHQEACFATGQLPGNAVSILRPTASEGTNGKLILQEVSADTSCMVLAYDTADEKSLQHAMTTGDHTSLSLLPSGLIILPDGVSPAPTSAASSSSTAVTHKSKAGSFVSAIYQIQLNVQPPERLSSQATDNAKNQLCRVISKIKDVVHASSVVHA